VGGDSLDLLLMPPSLTSFHFFIHTCSCTPICPSVRLRR
jgi:hypothetical protein